MSPLKPLLLGIDNIYIKEKERKRPHEPQKLS
jgi:hypothetical protein